MWCLLSILAAAPLTTSGPSLRFEDALAAVEAAGDLAGLEAAAQVRTDGLTRLGSLTSNPQLTLQPGIRTDGTTTAPEGQLTLTQSFNLGGLGAARKDAARAEAGLATLQHSVLRHQRRVAVAQAWLDTWAAQAAATAVREEETQAKELLARLEKGLAAGGVTRVEVATARAFAAEAAALHLDWEGRRVEAGALLSTLLGLETIASADGTLPVFGEPNLAALAGAGTGPMKVLEGELEAEQRRAEETRAQWATSLHLSLQGGRESPNQWFGNIGVGLTVPIFERGQRERSAHAANARQLAGDISLAGRRARISREVARHELEHSAETLHVVKHQQLPAAEEAARLEAQRYALGEATLFELTQLRRQALGARITTAIAEARFAGARAYVRELLETP